MHTRRFHGYVHERAILGRCNTRHGAFRLTRGRWRDRELRALSTVPCFKHLLSAKGSRHAFGIAQSTRKECIHLCSHSGPIHGFWLDMAHLMGERWVTQTRVRAL